ncbi:MAG: hypothetical protein HFJ04_06015 [Lachnospiraceae bacterium]|nr:hypothetical protein [Lachnospiraceae bacterium]
MRKQMTELYLKGQLKLLEWKDRFLQEETGASHMVEIIVVIVIVIAVATVFRTQLLAAMTTIMDKLTEFIG